MSVLAVGDLYKLPSVRQAKPLCVYELTQIDLCCNHFQMITLTEMRRQKDDVPFAAMLNQICVKENSDVLSEEDRALLSQAIDELTHCPKDILHVYSTNKKVDDHKSASLVLFHSEIIIRNAHNYKKTKLAE